jgi:hypothetical protein
LSSSGGLGAVANGGCIDDFDFGEEAVATARDGFDEARAFGGVAECVANFVDGLIEAVIEIDVGVGGPEIFLEVLAGDEFAGMLDEYGEDTEGLFLDSDAQAVFAEFAGAKIEFEDSETELGAGLSGVGHRN